MKSLKRTDIFTPNNTHWEYEDGEPYLVYEGSLEELAEETKIPEDELYELLGEYEDLSRDLIDTERAISEAKRGEY